MRLFSCIHACILFVPYMSAENSTISHYINFIGETDGLPRLGFGTAGLGSHTRQLTLSALELGMKMIDSAQAQCSLHMILFQRVVEKNQRLILIEWYREDLVGQAIHTYNINTENGDKILVVTKIHPRDFEFNKMRRAIEKSRQNLLSSTTTTIPSTTTTTTSSSMLDVVLLHSPYCWPNHCTPEEESLSWHTGWRNLELMKRQGEIAYIGVSNFDTSLLKELLTFTNTKVSVIQNWMDPLHQDKATRHLATQHHIIYMAYSSLGTQWEMQYTYNPVLNSPILKKIAEKNQLTIPQVVISWLLQSNVVAIPRTSNIHHLSDYHIFYPHHTNPLNDTSNTKENTDKNDYLNVFLSEQDMKTINHMDTSVI